MSLMQQLTWLKSAILTPAPSLKRFPKTIVSLSAFVTQNCNSRCLSCDCWKSTRPWAEHLSAGQWGVVMADLASLGLRRVRVSGGEPFLYPEMFTFLDAAAALKLEVSIQTNGLLLSRLAERINAAPIASLHVSLDGVGGNNDELRGVPGHFARVAEGIGRMRKPVYVTTTPYASAIDDMEELVAFCRASGVAGLEFNLPSTDLHYLKDATVVFPDAAQVTRFTKLLRRHADYLRISPGNLAFMEAYLRRREINYRACELGLRKVYVSERGDVFSACFPLGPLGNVLTSGVKTIVTSDAYRERLSRMLALKCPGCVCGYQGNPKRETEE